LRASDLVPLLVPLVYPVDRACSILASPPPDNTLIFLGWSRALPIFTEFSGQVTSPGFSRDVVLSCGPSLFFFGFLMAFWTFEGAAGNIWPGVGNRFETPCYDCSSILKAGRVYWTLRSGLDSLLGLLWPSRQQGHFNPFYICCCGVFGVGWCVLFVWVFWFLGWWVVLCLFLVFVFWGCGCGFVSFFWCFWGCGPSWADLP